VRLFLLLPLFLLLGCSSHMDVKRILPRNHLHIEGNEISCKNIDLCYEKADYLCNYHGFKVVEKSKKLGVYHLEIECQE